jgi:protein phosphatase
MGTSLTAVWLHDEPGFTFAHAGDTRLYLWRGGQLKRVTEDHTLVQEQLRVGLIESTEVQAHPLRHVITNSLGSRVGIRIDLGGETFAAGELVLLCTDGLYATVKEPRIAEIMAGGGHLQLMADQLVELANAAGGPDNITVALARRLR